MTDTAAGLSQGKERTRSKQFIAHEVRSLSEFLKQHLGEREAEACRNLMAKLVEDRFTLAVVGQYKRGKSTLMNAIIGKNLLPSGVLPLTSAITVLKYGPRERLTLLKEGALYPEPAPIANIADYVTERGNPGNRRRVVKATVEVPAPFLRRGLELVDTPGIGSHIEANTATTYEFVPQSDAVIFVTGVDTPLTRAEMEFLGATREHVRKIFFVLNKIDLVSEAEQQAILSFISETLDREIGADHIRLFPVSSAVALEMSLAGNKDGYESSGLKTFEDALCDFLAAEKDNVLLVSVMDKLLRLVSNATHQMSLLKLAGESSQEEGRKILKALEARFESLRNGRRDSLDEVCGRTIPWVKERIEADIRSFREAERRKTVDRLKKSLSQLRWKPSLLAAREIAGRELKRIRDDLVHATTELVEHLDPQAVDVLRQESLSVLRELQKIRVDSLRTKRPTFSARFSTLTSSSRTSSKSCRRRAPRRFSSPISLTCRRCSRPPCLKASPNSGK